MSLRIVNNPALEPVSVDEAKAHLRVTHSLDDAYIESLIQAARESAESFTGRAFLSQGWELSLDSFPDSEIEVPAVPLLSVSSIQYYDSEGAEQTMDSGDYYVDTKSIPGRLIPVDSWPSTYDRPNAITVTLTVGYGEAADDVPKAIRQAILLLVGEMYENREETAVGVSASKLPLTSERLLFPYRVFL